MDIRDVCRGRCGGYIVDGRVALIAYNWPGCGKCPEYDECPFSCDEIEADEVVDGWDGVDRDGWVELRRLEKFDWNAWIDEVLAPLMGAGEQ